MKNNGKSDVRTVVMSTVMGNAVVTIGSKGGYPSGNDRVCMEPGAGHAQRPSGS